MAKTLPDNSSSIFLLCEDVRQEVGNKLSFMGVFPNNDIVIPKGAPQIIPSLACVLVARGGSGSLATQLTVVDPDGFNMAAGPLENVMAEAGKSHLMLMKMIGPTMKFGVYKANFRFDDFIIERKFEVKEG